VKKTFVLLWIALIAAPASADWTGFYLGGQLGVGLIDASQPYGDVGGPYDSSQPDAEGSGAVYGGLIGYNWQSGEYVYGTEMTVDLSSIEGDDNGGGGDVNGVEVKSIWMARGRAGIVSGQTLYYGVVAYSVMRAYASAPGADKNLSFKGWTLGAGAERPLGSHWRMRVEYQYGRYGAEQVDFAGPNYGEEIEPEIQSLVLGVSLRF
jgi:outer membrane immunogenic protein